jgi:hypothetical protein
MIAHARQLRAAIWSQKAAQKGKDNGFVSTKAGEANKSAINIFELKIWSKFARGDQLGSH